MHIDLPVIWAAIIGFGVFMYVMLDGFDLGIGLIFPLFNREGERQVMLNTVAPVWDGNETWMVLGGACLYAVFPLAYSILLPATYLPIIAMLCGLIFRGVAFEIRAKARRTQHLWDLAFITGSAVATFAQGVILGTLLQGVEVRDGKYAGGPFDWFSPFNLFTGLGLLVTYATLGCGWLLMKTEGELQRRMALLMRPLTLTLGATVGIVSLWTIAGQESVATRWFTLPDLFFFLPVPVLVIACLVGILVQLRRGNDRAPFLLTLAILFLGYSGLIISIFPNIIPPSVDIWTASAARSSQLFTLVGAAIIIPIILTYTSLAYWVFRGKVKPDDEGYH
ncbi:MAG TPA: cytochrome d ubiquinol oxidase subunit II [Luteibacter sp.]|jgi:cytochrome d ubiquinol oxidase subunit II|nr:cytochrome d ubiquinol oxidase subunit II [Luteibacter sp.]